MLINVKVQTIVVILTLLNRINFVLICKKFHILGARNKRAEQSIKVRLWFIKSKELLESLILVINL